MVLVHGIGMSHRSFARTQRILARTHRTVAVDLPGFGGVPPVGRAVQVEELGALVVEAVRSRGAGDLVLVGQSMGTQVVVAAARRHPEAVASLVLIGPVVDPARRTLLQQALDLGRDTVVEDPRMNGVVLTDYLRSMRQYVRELRPMLRYRLEEVVPTLTQPVLVVRGDRDPSAAATGRLRSPPRRSAAPSSNCPADTTCRTASRLRSPAWSTSSDVCRRRRT